MIEADQGKLYDELKQYIDTVKSNPGILISVLHKAQGLFGYLPVEVQKFIAMQLNLPFSQVYGVVTFYNFFFHATKGKTRYKCLPWDCLLC
jgi:NADH-quinone oxidoreductase subunit E